MIILNYSLPSKENVEDIIILNFRLPSKDSVENVLIKGSNETII